MTKQVDTGILLEFLLNMLQIEVIKLTISHGGAWRSQFKLLEENGN